MQAKTLWADFSQMTAMVTSYWDSQRKWLEQMLDGGKGKGGGVGSPKMDAGGQADMECGCGLCRRGPRQSRSSLSSPAAGKERFACGNKGHFARDCWSGDSTW